jgi:hypothetical protein
MKDHIGNINELSTTFTTKGFQPLDLCKMTHSQMWVGNRKKFGDFETSLEGTILGSISGQTFE